MKIKNILKNKYLHILSSLYFLSASYVFAEVTEPTDFKGLVKIFIDLINSLIPVILSLCLIVFFWGLAKFILKSGDSAELKNGKRFMLWGLIVFFVFTSIWGILFFISSSLGLNTNSGMVGEVFLPIFTF